jgi:hypothetical protein
MEKQLLATVVVFLFCLLYTVAIAAQTKGAMEENKIAAGSATTTKASETRSVVHKFGFGKRVDVKLTNGSKTSGRITGLASDQFVVTDSKGKAISIEYVEVSQITKQKEKLGIFHRPWVAIMFTAAGVGTLIVVTLAWLN